MPQSSNRTSQATTESQPSTVLVTGCAGFIGSQVAALLLREGRRVIGVDNLNDAYDPRLKEWRLARLEGEPGFNFHRLDICDRESLRRLLRTKSAVGAAPFDAVINLAARAGVRQSVKNPWVYVQANIVGNLNLLELCRETGVKKFVLASTSSLYGAKSPRPFKEDAVTDYPLSPYAASKKAAEALCYTYHYLYDIDVSVVRYFTVYGPAGRPDMSLFRFVQWIAEGRPVIVYGDGTQQRDFSYVEDIASGTVASLSPLGYEMINLGSDRPVALNQAIQLIERLVGREATIENRPRDPSDVLATWADITKAKRILGWRPRFSFEEGVARLVQWYKENREWAREIRTV